MAKKYFLSKIPVFTPSHSVSDTTNQRDRFREIKLITFLLGTYIKVAFQFHRQKMYINT